MNDDLDVDVPAELLSFEASTVTTYTLWGIKTHQNPFVHIFSKF